MVVQNKNYGERLVIDNYSFKVLMMKKKNGLLVLVKKEKEKKKIFKPQLSKNK